MTNIKEEIGKGNIHCKIILEIIGKPEEHVKKSSNEYLEKINKEDNKITIVKKFISETTKLEKGELYSLFIELELLIKGFSNLSKFCFDYMPSSIEIYEPNRMVVDANKMSTLFNDFQEKLHKADFLSKSLAQQNRILGTNLTAMVKNSLIILLKEQGRTIEEICKYTGLKQEDMLKYLEELMKKEKIKQIGDKYFYQF
tara:strand:- start:733 stop:1329 length:597 start_codon:yes stop_codon:yes gene_type:complete